MIILITGDRNWTDENRIRKVFDDIPNHYISSQLPPDVVIHGGARGADRLGGKIAAEYGWIVKVVPANWEKYGRAAGPIRNQEMLDMDPDLVLAFHDDLENSKGTKDMVRRARKKGVKVVHIGNKG